jgi:hypothetical protein
MSTPRAARAAGAAGAGDPVAVVTPDDADVARPLGSNLRGTKLFSISPADVDAEEDIDVLKSVIKRLVSTGAKYVAEKQTEQKRRENVMRKGGAGQKVCPDDADEWEKGVIYAMMDDGDPELAKENARAATSVGRGHIQRRDRFLRLVGRCYNGEWMRHLEDEILKKRGVDSRTAAAAIDAGVLNYKSIDKIRALNGDAGTATKRNMRPCALPSSSSAQRVNVVLDAYVAEKGLIGRSSRHAEMWEPDYDKLMDSTFELRGYAQAYAASPSSGAWRNPEGPSEGTLPMLIVMAVDDFPCETGKGGTGMTGAHLRHVDPRLGFDIAKSPQQSSNVQTVVLYPTQTRKALVAQAEAEAVRKRSLAAADGDEDDDAVADAVADGLADAPLRARLDDYDPADDFEGALDDEDVADDGVESPILASKREVVGKRLGSLFDAVLKCESCPTCPVKVALCADKIGQYELGPFGGATLGFYVCNLCPCPRFLKGQGQPGGCKRCRATGDVDTCTHWDQATPATLEFFEDLERSLAAGVGKIPDKVLPHWRNRVEALELSDDRGLGLARSSKLEVIECALRSYCDCLVVTGDTASVRHVDSASNGDVHRDAVRWAEAAGRPEPARPRSAKAWSAMRQTLKERLVDAERLLIVRQVLKFWDRLEPEDRQRLVTRDGHIADPTRLIDCSMHLTLRVVTHVMGLLFSWPLDATLGLDSAEITRRLEKATDVVRKAINSDSFAPRKAKAGKKATSWAAGSKLAVFSMPAHVAKRIGRTSVKVDEATGVVEVVECADSLPDETDSDELMVGAADAVPLLAELAEILICEDDDRLSTVLEFIKELTFVLGVINSKDWEDDSTMPKRFQGHADAMGKHLLAVFGDAAVTIYLHDILAGHIYDMLNLYGPICRSCNEAAERQGGALVLRYKRHSQRGGAGAKGKLVGKCHSMGTWAGRQAVRGAGRADEVLNDAAAKRKRLRSEGAQESADAAAGGDA